MRWHTDAAPDGSDSQPINAREYFLALIHSPSRTTAGGAGSTEHWQAGTLRQDGSAVSWGAILAGAAAAAALSLILLMLGVGLGLSSVSPWSGRGASAGVLGASTILWVILTQLLSCAMGGYLAGRLRSKWLAVHTDEVYFRDTAHGFLAWGIASLATAALLTGTIGAIVGAGVQAGATVAAGAVAPVARTDAAQPGRHDAAGAYFIDILFRKRASPAAMPGPAPVAEVSRIFSHALADGSMATEDVRYVGQLVAQATAIAQPEAEKRVTDSFGQMQAQRQAAQSAAKQAVDTARTSSAHAAMWLFISLLIGAFTASWTATLGGRGRDA